MDLDNDPTVLAVRKHLVEHLGPPEEVFELEASQVPNSPLATLNLAYFAPGGPEAPVVFATCGASLFRMKDGRRVEALIILAQRPPDAQLPAVRRLLGSFALFAETNDEVVQLGDVVQGGEDLAEFSEMNAVLFVPPFTFLPSFHRIGLEDDEAIDMVWLMPLYAAEAEYALHQGPQTLLMLLAGLQLDLTDPRRPPADTSISPEEAADRAQAITEEALRQGAQRNPAPSRPPRTGEAPSIKVQDDGSLQAQRAVPPAAAAPKAAGSRPRRPVGRTKPPANADVRFDLAKDGIQQSSKPARPTRASAPDRPKPVAPAKPKPTKAERVAALKKAARAARARAKARQEGVGAPATTEPAPPGTTSAPARARPTSSRRPAPFRRGGAAPAFDADSDLGRARRRGAPLRQDPPNRDSEGDP